MEAKNKDNVNIIANYPGIKKKAAIIEMPVGLGQVILSAVHFEHNPYKDLSQDRKLLQVNNELKKYEKQRRKLFRYIVNKLLKKIR